MNFRDIPQFTRDGNWECFYPFHSFVQQIDEFIEHDGLEMNPDFQRGHVWAEEQQIKFVEFILKGGKTGHVIYLNHPYWTSGDKASKGEFVCVDGLQRTTAIQRFVRNEIPVFNTYFKDFEGGLRPYQYMRININTLHTREDVLKWYLEMNSGGTPHTKEELDKVKAILKSIK